MRKRFSISPALLLLLLSLLLAAPAASANTIVFSTASGATNMGGDPVNASATFTTGSGTLTIDLSNLLTATQVLNVAQNLSDLSFTLSAGTSGSVTSSTGTFIDVGASGAVTSASSVSGSSTDLIGWALTGNGLGSFELTGLSGSLAGPAQTIIGGTAGSSTAYSSGNGSIDDNGPHNPFTQGTGEFVLSIAGVTSNTQISNVVFSFGTTAGNDVPASTVPEPASIALFGSGLLGLAGLVRRRPNR